VALSAILPVAIPLVVRLAEKIFGRKTGKTKKLPVVQDIIAAILKGFEAPGVGLPGKDEYTDMIEKVVAALNSTGELKGEDTALTPGELDPEMAAIAGQLIQSAQMILAKARKK
jgi:hypothetical protein